jgi:hypothetical protein
MKCPPPHAHVLDRKWEWRQEEQTLNLAEMVLENVTGSLTQSHVTVRNELSTTYSSVTIELLLLEDKLQDN